MDTAEDLIRGLVAPPPWMRDALCREHPDVNFFIERGEPSTPAKAVCDRCLVRDDCLSYALEHAIQFGIWAGLSPRERTKMSSRGPAAPVRIEWRGRSLTADEWALETGVSATTIRNRLSRGWDVESALTKPPASKDGALIHFRGQSRTIKDWAGHLGMSQSTLRARLANGWPPERALSEPAKSPRIA